MSQNEMRSRSAQNAPKLRSRRILKNARKNAESARKNGKNARKYVFKN
jgi:hypothetical protein